jgi:phage gp29-like protein
MDLIELITGRSAVPAPPRIEPPLTKPPGLEAEQASPMVSSFSRNPYGGHPAAGLTPVALAIILRSSIDGSPMRYLELAEDMEERFWQYASTLSTRKRAVANLDITVNPAGDEKADLDEAELVREVIQSSAFNLIKIDLLDAIGKSFSAVEMIWDTSTKPWKPVKFKHRDPRFFEFDRTDPEKLLLLTDHGREELWQHCWIVHRAKAKSGLTIRGGVARQAAWLFLFQSFNIKDWAIFAEAYGQPLRVGKFDPGASDKDKAILLEAVHQIGADYAAVIPQAMAIEFIKAEITGSTDLYERRADWLDRQCSKIVLGQTGTTDTSTGSGYAQAKVHDDVRDDIAEADGDQLAATLNDQLVIPLIDFNFPRRARKGYPEIIIGRPEEEDVEALVKNVAELIPLGLEVSMAEMQRKIGVTAPEAGAKLLTAPRAAASVGKDQLPVPEDEKATTAAARPDEDAVADAIDAVLGNGGWEPLLAPLAADVRARLLAATTPDEALAALAQAFAGLDIADLTTQLSNAMFAARLAGELDEDL